MQLWKCPNSTGKLAVSTCIANNAQCAAKEQHAVQSGTLNLSVAQ